MANILRILLIIGMFIPVSIKGDALPEYRLKAAFVYNFIAYTEWPNDLGTSVNLCLIGSHPFGEEIDSLHGRHVNQYHVAVKIKKISDNLQDCEAVFISNDAISYLPEILEKLDENPILTIADTESAIDRGIMLNIRISHQKLFFEANQKSARSAGLMLNAKLLRLATRVYQ